MKTCRRNWCCCSLTRAIFYRFMCTERQGIAEGALRRKKLTTQNSTGVVKEGREWIPKRQRERDTERMSVKKALVSKPHPTYQPSSTCHRSIPVRPLISHEPLGDCINSAKSGFFSVELRFIHTNAHASTHLYENMYCTQMLTLEFTPTCMHILTVLCVLHNSCV